MRPPFAAHISILECSFQISGLLSEKTKERAAHVTVRAFGVTKLDTRAEKPDDLSCQSCFPT